MIINQLFIVLLLLLTIDDPVFSKANAIGVRLEDLKLEPKTTISNLCRWLNIEENSAMYQMTAQGKNGGVIQRVLTIKKMGWYHLVKLL